MAVTCKIFFQIGPWFFHENFIEKYFGANTIVQLFALTTNVIKILELVEMELFSLFSSKF